ncbi:MAG: class I SAM-dependent methyltransferase [Caldilineaceae bacterium]
MTSSWRQRFDKAKTHVLNGDPTALVNETKQYLYWKGVLTPPSTPAPSVGQTSLHRPTEEEFWDEVDVQVERSVAWLAACDGALGAWAEEELLGGGHLGSSLPALMDAESRRSPKYALVLGCGDMRSEHSMLIHPDVQFDRIDAYDVSTQSMQRAKEFTDSLGLKVTYQAGDANTMDFPADTYSLVICYFAYHHFREVDRVAAQIAKTLTDGGIFVTIDYVGRRGCSTQGAVVLGAPCAEHGAGALSQRAHRRRAHPDSLHAAGPDFAGRGALFRPDSGRLGPQPGRHASVQLGGFALSALGRHRRQFCGHTRRSRVGALLLRLGQAAGRVGPDRAELHHDRGAQAAVALPRHAPIRELWIVS